MHGEHHTEYRVTICCAAGGNKRRDGPTTDVAAYLPTVKLAVEGGWLDSSNEELLVHAEEAEEFVNLSINVHDHGGEVLVRELGEDQERAAARCEIEDGKGHTKDVCSLRRLVRVKPAMKVIRGSCEGGIPCKNQLGRGRPQKAAIGGRGWGERKKGMHGLINIWLCVTPDRHLIGELTEASDQRFIRSGPSGV
ncbi:hypothetical protein B0H17DRAFT_1135903 [Mycena rosella]|uniref:Uncharacterized protein n=1 Tax=Mycena rosella TaxID=1033263 RepID=A0AAD7DC78_MYCRO|nr:hypothetical protein B0H17DRAFT_1135903 [Mycena rosella]